MNDDQATPTPPDSEPAHRRRGWGALIWITVALVLSLGGGWLYHYVTAGGMTARQKPSSFETFVARHLVELSIPKEARSQKNPLAATAATFDAGRGLYQKHCEVCHGYDGNGKTAASGGLFPTALSLSQTSLAERKRTDGELFYFIRNGVRNTGMPAWQLPDDQTWQLVAYIRKLPPTAAVPGTSTSTPFTPSPSLAAAHYVGSQSCKECHSDIYERWKKTPMANVVRDPKEHPEAITPDLSKPDPLLTFTKDDIAFVYGSIWKQRYFKKVGDDYYPFPAQWDVTHKKWKPYFVKDDWWVAHYPPDNFQRPTSALCDGCHSVNYEIQKKTVTEWNVGCEKCHGPGSEHLKQPVANTIMCPSRMDYVAGNDTCIQCHSQGRPLTNPIDGKYYDWPVGYEIAKRLRDYWQLEEHKLGETTFTHFADGTAHKNRMQGNDYVKNAMYVHGVTCYTCHDVHGTAHPAQLRKPANTLCLDCHGPASPSGPHASTLEAHTHHKPGSTGSECIACHMPKIAATLGDVNVRSHTFKFVSPAVGEVEKIPNACNACHTDKSTTWAAEALTTWGEHSPWRVAE